MTDRPILFSGPMVRALIAGTKKQTRRTLNPQPFIDASGNFCAPDRKGKVWNWGQQCDGRPCVRNYIDSELRIKVGDQLYVREHWRCHYTLDQTAPRDLPPEIALTFVADGDSSIHQHSAGRFRQGMHMPRWASRITLKVTDVRVERLQGISDADALAEGVAVEHGLPADVHRHYVEIGNGEVVSGWDARDCYGNLWEHINGGGTWAANPWVAAYTFTVRLGNVDGERCQP